MTEPVYPFAAIKHNKYGTELHVQENEYRNITSIQVSPELLRAIHKAIESELKLIDKVNR